MKKLIVLIALFISVDLLGQENYQLTVEVEKVEKLEGKVMIALYNEEGKFLKTELMGGSVEAESQLVSYSFKGLEKGIYAVSIFHDINGNGKLDANFIGIPTEPYAFSNDAKGTFGPPNFEACKFELHTEDQKIVIKL